MFNDIGKKIKTLAELICWIGILISLILGLIFVIENIFVGFIIFIIGVLSSWVGSIFLYGFGELVDNSTKIVNGLELINRPEGKPNEANPNA
jgi:hypothetical protein